jgi:hypothetical protein
MSFPHLVSFFPTPLIPALLAGINVTAQVPSDSNNNNNNTNSSNTSDNNTSSKKNPRTQS